MRTLATRLLVICVIWMMTPGLSEATEDLWHLVRAGHAAHSSEAGPDHAPEGDEHGCSGSFHLCGCHNTPMSTLTYSGTGPEAPPQLDKSGVWSPAYLQAPDLPGLFRPPRA